MFCGCKNDPFHAPQPNIYTCPVCLGMPGGLPVPNQTAIEWTVKLGLALHSQINLFSKFDRKHYFYPDLPKGYQISQYDIPFCQGGYVDTAEGKVNLTRIHLEEDTGKLVHQQVDGQNVSLVDFNRAGVPLVEIVTEPDIKSASQAKEYGKKLRQLIRYLNIGDCDMEQGGMRLEANISLKTPGSAGLPNYKVEVKNINSFRFMEQAIAYEVNRQAKLLSLGQTPTQETRGFNPNTGKTFSQRAKETAEDYRYFPDPDIPPIKFSSSQVAKLKAQLPELPEQVMANWQKKYGVETRFAQRFITTEKSVEFYSSLFNQTVSNNLDANKLASMIMNGKLNTDDDAKQIIKKFRGATHTDQIDQAELLAVIKQVMKNNPKEKSIRDLPT